MDLPPDPDQTWNLLPAELKMKILSYLSPEDLEAAGLTNQDFHQNAAQIYDTHIDYWVAELAQQLDVLEPLVYSGPADEVAAAPRTVGACSGLRTD